MKNKFLNYGGETTTLDNFLACLDGVSGSGGQFSARCPAHDDKRASLSISAGSDGRILLNCHAGCTPEDITAAVGLKLSDLFQRDSEVHSSKQRTRRTLVAEYIYTDLSGAPVAKKLRYSDKSFCWLKPDSSGGWTKGRNGKAPLFNQAQAKNAQNIFLVEGEKDVLTLSQFGKPAVSLPDGAGSKWLPEYSKFFKGRKVAIIPDNDKPGKDFAQTAAKELYSVAKLVKVLDLSEIWENIPEHGDISDYVDAHSGTDLHELSELANDQPEWIPESRKRYVTLSDVTSTTTEWLWYPYIPSGKITLMTADPGTGKTFLSLYLAAAVSDGRAFYGQDEAMRREPRTAIYQTAEDGVADTIKPRLEPMNPDFSKIVIIDESQVALSLSDVSTIEEAMEDLHPALMIFDPLQAYLGADVDMHRANEVRPILSRIGQLAEKYHCAVIFIMHNSKMGQNQALYRALGSIDIPAIARSMLVIGKHPEDSTLKVMCHEKSSLAAHGKSVLFRIAPNDGGIRFEGFSDLKADEILNPKKASRDKPSVALEDATELLRERMDKKGWMHLSEVKQLQEEYGLSKGTLYNAKDALQLQTVQVGYSKAKITYWLNPDINKIVFKAQRLEEYAEQDNNWNPPF